MTVRLPVTDYDLAATLGSGQVFRWHPRNGVWEGILGNQWFQLRQTHDGLEVEASGPVPDLQPLRQFLRIDEDLNAIRATFPKDPPMEAALSCCPGLRLLRQDPWECLASFILSSTKQIVQIQQCVTLLSERFGEPVSVPANCSPSFAFPTARRLATATEAELRGCKLGFRARYLGETARAVDANAVDLGAVGRLSTPRAREALVGLPGVGPKIADCVLLFAYGRQDAFPVDVWVLRALRCLYFPNRHPSARTLDRFTATHFGANAGYAQQYLFHYVRTHLGRQGLHSNAPRGVPSARRIRPT